MEPRHGAVHTPAPRRKRRAAGVRPPLARRMISKHGRTRSARPLRDHAPHPPPGGATSAGSGAAVRCKRCPSNGSGRPTTTAAAKRQKPHRRARPGRLADSRTCAHPQAAPSGPKPRTSPAPDPTSSPPATWSTHGATPATSNNPLTRVLGAFHRELVLHNGEHHCPWPQGAVNTRASPAPGRPRIRIRLGTHSVPKPP